MAVKSNWEDWVGLGWGLNPWLSDRSKPYWANRDPVLITTFNFVVISLSTVFPMSYSPAAVVHSSGWLPPSDTHVALFYPEESLFRDQIPLTFHVRKIGSHCHSGCLWFSFSFLNFPTLSPFYLYFLSVHRRPVESDPWTNSPLVRKKRYASIWHGQPSRCSTLRLHRSQPESRATRTLSAVRW